MNDGARSAGVLDYRPPLEDRPLTRLTAWVLLPMSPRWRTLVVASSWAVLWGAAWLPGAAVVEVTAWAALAVWVTYALWRRHARWYVRCTRGLPLAAVPESERFTRRQAVVVGLAVSSLFYNWPLLVGLCIQRPLLERFAWHAYAEAPMLDPPATPLMVGVYVVTDVRATPTDVTVRVMGARDALEYAPPDRDSAWRRERSPSLLRWTTPAGAGIWSIDSMRYRPCCG